MSMFQKYLLKKKFWPSHKDDEFKTPCYVRHDLGIGGIYAYPEPRGVKIVTEANSQYFSNFDDLDNFFNRLTLSARDTSGEFMQIINRRVNTKILRQIPM